MTASEQVVAGAVAPDADTPVLVQAARALAPRIAAAADEIERERRVPEPLVHALADAGMFNMLVPAYLGGAETDLATFALAIEEIAKADGSVGWCLAQGAGYAVEAVRMNREAASRIWGNPRGVVAAGVGSGTALAVEGGYGLSGRWTFASGAHHATWLAGRLVTVQEADGTVRTGATGKPELCTFLFPVADAVFTDVWQVSGLRGTGSDDYAVTDLFVPHANMLAAAGEHTAALGPLYAVPTVSLWGVGFASVALGIARASVEAFVVLAQTKKPLLGATVLREDAVVQTQLGHAEADLRAAHAFLHLAIDNAWNSACRTRALTLEERVVLRLAATHAIHAAVRVVDTVYRAAGASAIFASNPFERRFRDIDAVTQQAQAAEAHFETAGRFFLGADVKRLAWTL